MVFFLGDTALIMRWLDMPPIAWVGKLVPKSHGTLWADTRGKHSHLFNVWFSAQLMFASRRLRLAIVLLSSQGAHREILGVFFQHGPADPPLKGAAEKLAEAIGKTRSGEWHAMRLPASRTKFNQMAEQLHSQTRKHASSEPARASLPGWGMN